MSFLRGSGSSVSSGCGCCRSILIIHLFVVAVVLVFFAVEAKRLVVLLVVSVLVTVDVAVDVAVIATLELSLAGVYCCRAALSFAHVLTNALCYGKQRCQLLSFLLLLLADVAFASPLSTLLPPPLLILVSVSLLSSLLLLLFLLFYRLLLFLLLRVRNPPNGCISKMFGRDCTKSMANIGLSGRCSPHSTQPSLCWTVSPVIRWQIRTWKQLFGNRFSA